ncbi:MAG: polyprenyl synthetase family protein [Gemmatimonadota bacterium]|nr:polyprenyl synthetase family protein [Gemmatimonadota bacterium]
MIADLADELARDRRAVDSELASLCDQRLGALPVSVARAIRYSLLGEGKRLRPMLTLATYRATGGCGSAFALASAVEVVHAYSLVHDDLPCMDDDDVRRGRPTTHRAFGVEIAAAAGLAMVPLAARAASDGARALGLLGSERGAIVRELMRASGGGGMVGGQLLDLSGEGLGLTLAELERIHRAKTGALIEASVRIGGIAARADAHSRTALDRYGAALGLAFQIADDVLDATSTTGALGKTAGRDALLRKSTYPRLLGVEGAIARAALLAEEACDAVRDAGVLTPALEQLARFSVARRW